MTTKANDFLMGGAGPRPAKFTAVGAVATGRIVAEPQVRQQTEFGTNKPLFWDDGSPREQLVVEIQTDELDPADTKDDGVRAIYVKGKSLTTAVRNAVLAAGAEGLEVGGVLTVTYIGDGKAERGNPPKLYSASYAKPAAAAQAASNFLGTTAVPADDDACPPNFDPSVWSQLDKGQRERTRAALGAAK